jgi:hypothetical protein
MALGGLSLGLSSAGAALPWLPKELGAGLKLWVRPEELTNPNRLLYTDDLENANWTKGSLTVTAGQTDPDGGSTAFLLTSSAGADNCQQDAVGIQVDADEAASVWIKRGPNHDGVSNSQFRLREQGGSSSWTASWEEVPPAEWTRIEITGTNDSDTTQVIMFMYPDPIAADVANNEIFVWHPQLESGIAASPYRANAATAGGLLASWADQSGNGYDVTEATQAEMPLIRANSLDGYPGAVFDGVDDLLQELTGSLAYSQPFAFYLLLDISTIPPSAFPAKFMDWPTGVDSAVISFSTGKWAVNAGSWVYEEAATTGPVVIEGIFNGASSKLSQNFGTQATVNPGSAACSGNLIVGPVNVGGDETILYEAIVTNTAPSAVERAKLAAYFAFKYPSLGI